VADLRTFCGARRRTRRRSPCTRRSSRSCREFFDDDAILVIDGGNTAVWTNLYHEHRTPGALLGTFKFRMLGAG
jgi:thiamine pyrophosphate-dependent acetolactate synthase large subunit-like protein